MESFDLIIVGGGISGLGLAREAAQSGYSTLLLEANRCGEATSNNTLRIIHGGFRYLQHLDLPRVIRSLNDQTALIKECPDAVKPLPCLMPLARTGLKSKYPVLCATLMYGGIMRLNRSPLPAPKIVSNKELQATIPLLQNQAPNGALCWHDALMVDPSAISTHLKTAASSHKAVIRENTPVASITKDGSVFTVSSTNGETFRTRCVITTLGPFLNSVHTPQELRAPRPLWCRGFNVTISRQLDPTYGISAESADKRLFFCVPRGSGTAIGTWYVPHPDPLTAPRVSDQEIEQFLQAFNAALPTARVTTNELTSIDVGILPMHSVTARGPQLIAHERIHANGGFIEVLSTKYTTFRSQAQATLAKAKPFIGNR